MRSRDMDGPSRERLSTSLKDTLSKIEGAADKRRQQQERERQKKVAAQQARQKHERESARAARDRARRADQQNASAEQPPSATQPPNEKGWLAPDKRASCKKGRASLKATAKDARRERSTKRGVPKPQAEGTEPAMAEFRYTAGGQAIDDEIPQRKRGRGR